MNVDVVGGVYRHTAEIQRSVVIGGFGAQEVEALVQVYFHLSAVGFGDEHPVIGGAFVGFLLDLASFARYGLYRRGAGLIGGRAGDLLVIGDGDADADAEAARTAALATPMPIFVLICIVILFLVVTLVAKATLGPTHEARMKVSVARRRSSYGPSTVGPVRSGI